MKTVNDLMKPKNIDVAVKCLNELICDALLHVSDSITYMSRLKNPMIFNFVAIQQVFVAYRCLMSAGSALLVDVIIIGLVKNYVR